MSEGRSCTCAGGAVLLLLSAAELAALSHSHEMMVSSSHEAPHTRMASRHLSCAKPIWSS